MEGEKLLNTRDLAEFLNIGIAEARLILRRGEIKGAVKIGNEWKYTASAVDDWLYKKRAEALR